MKLTPFEDCLVYSERKVVQFYFKSNAILKLHISSMLPVTSAIQSDILHLYLRAVDAVILLPAHPASFAHNFVSGMQSFYFSMSQDAIVLQTCH